MQNQEELDLFMDVCNPLDFAEDVMAVHDWTFERASEDEMSVHVSGQFGHYVMNFNWHDDVSALTCEALMDISIPHAQKSIAEKTLNDINAGLWLGHFDMITEGETAKNNIETTNPETPQTYFQPRFRHTSLMRGMTESSGVFYMQDLIQVALAECERYHMTFALLCKKTETSMDKLDFAIMDVAGLA